MTFCFAKAVTFDVNVNVGAASLSNVKSKINKKAPLLSPEWYFATTAVGNNPTLLRLQTESTAVANAGAFWSKDGGTTWVQSGVDATHRKEYRDYVTSVAKDYALEGNYERHHYEYKDSVRNQKGGFAAGLDVGVRYELTPCVKIGARAFFTATNLKQDVSYSVTPLDKNGNFASATAQNEREVQMLIGYGNAHGNDVPLGETQYLYGDALKIVKDNGDDKSLTNMEVGSTEKTSGDANASAMAFYALNINRAGQQILSKATKNGDKYEVTLDANTYGLDKGIVLTKTGIARDAAVINASDVQTAVCALYKNNNADEKLKARNYALKTSDLTVTATAIDAGDTVLKDSNFITMAANITDNRAAPPADDTASGLALNAALAAADSKAHYINSGPETGKVAETDKLVISEEKYNEIMQAFEEMSADFDRTVIDQTLKVKNVWGGMVTLSWNATDCTLFTLGLGVGVPSVSKIDNLKKKFGFAGMFEVSTKIADSFSVGLRYQYNRINLKEKDCDSAVHHLSKVNGNLHVFSANFTYAF